MKKIISKAVRFLKKLKPKQKDLTYEDFIDLEGKKFRMPSGSAESYGSIEIYRRYDR